MSERIKRITSTPYPKKPKTQNIDSFFDCEWLSPICEPGPSDNKDCQPLKGKVQTQSSATVEMVPRKRRCVEKKDNKESASGAVRKKLENRPTSAANILSQSRHLYNKLPPLIVIDSDDEDFLCAAGSKKSPKKETSTLRNYKKGISEKKKNDYEKETNTKTGKNNKKKPEDMENGNSREVEDASKRTSVDLKRAERNKASTSGKHPVATKTASHKKPLSTSSVVNISDESSIFLGCGLTSFKKKKIIDPSNLENIDEEDPIIWTPRGKRITQKICEAAKDKNEEVDNDISTVYENVSNTISRRNTKQNSDLDLTNKRGKFVVQVPKEETSKQGNINCLSNDLSDSISLFKDVVFKKNSHYGYLRGRGLQTATQSFGYLEIDNGTTFVGHQGNITFVVLEGKILVLMSRKTSSLTNGDMINIPTDSEYKFMNDGPCPALLLYVKQKKS